MDSHRMGIYVVLHGGDIAAEASRDRQSLTSTRTGGIPLGARQSLQSVKYSARKAERGSEWLCTVKECRGLGGFNV